MLGTIMVANVFFVIIPGQREMVKAKREGRVPDPVYGLRGKQRSVHNTYFTLPVLFAMISNHYAMTYGAKHNALVLIAMSVAGVCIRAWFVARHKAHERDGRTSPLTLALGLLLLAGVAFALAPATRCRRRQAALLRQRKNALRASRQIVQQRCVPCHSPTPTFAGLQRSTERRAARHARTHSRADAADADPAQHARDADRQSHPDDRGGTRRR